MKRLPLAALWLSGLAGLTLSFLLPRDDEEPAEGSRVAGLVNRLESSIAWSGMKTSSYQFSRLSVLTASLTKVHSRYVDPNRIEPEEMFLQSLAAAERQVPQFLARREGEFLHLSIGSAHQTLELAPIRNLDALHMSVRQVAQVLDSELPPEVDRSELEYALVNGILSTLDPHSFLIPPEASRDMDVENQGEFGGLGITISMEKGRLVIDYPLQDTPAYEAGLQPGDIILRIDGESTLNLDLQEAVGKLRGKVGEPVTITVSRDSWEQPREIEVVRALIKFNPVEGVLLEDAIGYVKIKNFNANVGEDLREHLKAFHQQAALKGLILDLRNNPGGYLNQAVSVSDTFLSRGTIVSTVEAGGQRREEMRATAEETWTDFPMVVLVNASSASASEIVAGALKARDRAAIFGERTFGKGSVQHLYDNPDDSRLKLTVARYLTPGDHSIQSIGIPPDILLQPSVVEAPEEESEEEAMVSLFWRERVRREADLGLHLEAVEDVGPPPAYAFRYLRDQAQMTRRSSELQPLKDPEVRFALESLRGAEGGSRGDVIESAGRLLPSLQEEELQHLAEAFESYELDWSVRQTDATSLLPALEPQLEDAALQSGSMQEVTLSLENTTDSGLSQLYAVTKSSLEWLDGLEFYFGHLEPGESGSWTRQVRFPKGFGDHAGDLKWSLFSRGTQLSSGSFLTTVEGSPLPQFDLELEVLDSEVPGTEGDGDGIPELGETVALRVHVQAKRAPGCEVFVKLKNRSRRAADLIVANAELGAVPQDETRSADLLLTILEQDSISLELSTGDASCYDYPGVMRQGFTDYFSQLLELELQPGEAWTGGSYQTPVLELEKLPPTSQAAELTSISGFARDDRAVSDLIIYHGDKKLSYEGGGSGRPALAFAADVQLEAGQNNIVVMVRDDQGMTALRSFVIWREDPEEETALNRPPDDAPPE